MEVSEIRSRLKEKYKELGYALAKVLGDFLEHNYAYCIIRQSNISEETYTKAYRYLRDLIERDLKDELSNYRTFE